MQTVLDYIDAAQELPPPNFRQQKVRESTLARILPLIDSARMVVVTWNVKSAGLQSRLAKILAEISLHRPDVVTLQEVAVESLPSVKTGLERIGMRSVLSSLTPGGLPYGNVLASTVPATLMRIAPAPYPESLLHAQVGMGHVIAVHIPNGSNHGWKKIQTFESLAVEVLAQKGKRLIVAGDFNAPFAEFPIVTHGQNRTPSGRWQPWSVFTDADQIRDRGTRWDDGEGWLFRHREQHGLRDAFRDRHPEKHAFSYRIRGGAERRFDHIFVSDDFRVNSAEYRVTALDDDLSDHAPLIVELGDS